ncbi:unnamed protein product [Brugia timori]|uniref:Uncharacterized protein n=1 Tax=Brugia timori TaxID=42155 RepID=A0A0R3QFA2_9BILA|nr:unnamed protein product [Brugia timori]
MHNQYHWMDGISIIHPSLESLIAGIAAADNECYRFMLFQSQNSILIFIFIAVPDYMVPVPCNNNVITYDILCKYVGISCFSFKNQITSIYFLSLHFSVNK